MKSSGSLTTEITWGETATRNVRETDKLNNKVAVRALTSIELLGSRDFTQASN
jgi:hypothetical protein